jgi:hypothetical protein
MIGQTIFNTPNKVIGWMNIFPLNPKLTITDAGANINIKYPSMGTGVNYKLEFCQDDKFLTGVVVIRNNTTFNGTVGDTYAAPAGLGFYRMTCTKAGYETVISSGSIVQA